MAEIRTSSAYDVRIVSVLLETDRLAGTTYEIGPSVSEINIFENVDLPYLTGNILIEDTTQLSTNISFQGTERIIIQLTMNGDDTSDVVKKTFVTTDMKVVPAHDTAEVYNINLIEEIAYLNRLVTVSKAYSGKPETIISKIFRDNLNTDVDVPESFQESAVPPLKVIVPNISPLAAARWVKDRMVTANGMPFFLYSTLNGPRPYLVDLEYMLSDETIRNRNRPYRYGQSFNRFSAGQPIDVQARNIESYKMPKAENMFKLAASGALNSTYEYHDTTREIDARFSSVKVNMGDVLDRMESAGIITPEQRGSIYDKEFTINDKTIAEYNPSVLTQIAPSNTYSYFANYYESPDVEQHKLKAISRAVRYYLLKSPMELSMPGYDFLGRGPNITIGTQIMVEFLSNNPDIVGGVGEVLDRRRSGKYMIYAMRHIIRPEKYMVSMMCTKLANQKQST